MAKEKADGLAQRYGADAKTCGYFQLHQFADVEHAEVWRSLLSAEIAADPQQAEAALMQPSVQRSRCGTCWTEWKRGAPRWLGRAGLRPASADVSDIR